MGFVAPFIALLIQYFWLLVLHINQRQSVFPLPSYLPWSYKLTRIVHVYYISHRHSSGPPGVFYTYFYNYARRLRLEKLLNLELSIS